METLAFLVNFIHPSVQKIRLLQGALGRTIKATGAFDDIWEEAFHREE
jgi:hypothetical protein